MPTYKRTLFLECLKGLVLASAPIHRSAQSGTVVHVTEARLQKGEVADVANFEVFIVEVEINLRVGCRAAKRPIGLFGASSTTRLGSGHAGVHGRVHGARWRAGFHALHRS
jgi:hypothetical protein